MLPFIFHQFCSFVSPCSERIARGRLQGALICVLIPFFLVAQEASSPVFPEERRLELREELSYEQEKKEKKEEKDAKSWFDMGGFKNWKIDLSDGTTMFILLILIAALGFLIYRMLDDVEMRKRTRGVDDEEEEINLHDLEEEHLVAEGVSLSLLERAERAGQYDVAIRLLYIQLLKELQDGNLIKYRRDFSNRDYQNQLRSSSFLPDFRDVTADYERFWYGKYPLERLGYRLVYKKFTSLNSAIQAATAKPDSYA